jgi:hypothetical protein
MHVLRPVNHLKVLGGATVMCHSLGETVKNVLALGGRHLSTCN